MTPLSVLAVAVASRRAGYVFIADGQLQDWGITVVAAANSTDIAGFAQERINELKPGVVVTEKRGAGSRKGSQTQELIKAVSETASHNYVLDVSVVRPRNHASKYEEASDLAARYPELVAYLPARRRRIYEFEPRGMMIFEALALAEAVINGPPDTLAAALG